MRETCVLGEIVLKEAAKLVDGKVKHILIKFVPIEELNYNKIFGDIKVINSVKNSKPKSIYLNESENGELLDNTICLLYRDSWYPPGYIFKSKLLENAEYFYISKKGS